MEYISSSFKRSISMNCHVRACLSTERYKMMQCMQPLASSETTDHSVDDYDADCGVVSFCDDLAMTSGRLLPAINSESSHQSIPFPDSVYAMTQPAFFNDESLTLWRRFVIGGIPAASSSDESLIFITSFTFQTKLSKIVWFECECDVFILTSFCGPLEFDSLQWVFVVVSVSFHSSSSTAFTTALSPFEVPVVVDVSTTLSNIAEVPFDSPKSQTGVVDPLAFCK